MDITEMGTFTEDDNQSTTSTESDEVSLQLSVHSDTESRDDGQRGVNGEQEGVQGSGEAGSSVSVSSLYVEYKLVCVDGSTLPSFSMG